MPEVIACIRRIEVGLNVNADEAWDICLVGEFDTLDAVRAYSSHPSHLAVSGALKPFVAARACVDYAV